MAQYVYILRCADNSYYTGNACDLTLRLYGQRYWTVPKVYPYHRRPIELVWYKEFSSTEEVLFRTRQIKAWSRAKKEALIRGEIYPDQLEIYPELRQ